MKIFEIAAPEYHAPSASILAKAETDGFDISQIYYHGTNRRFSDFRAPKNDPGNELGPGVYVTSRRYVAYAWARGAKGYIIKCVVRKGPLYDLAGFRMLGLRWDLKHLGFLELYRGHCQMMREMYGEPGVYTLEGFQNLLNETRDRVRLINVCLSYAGYVGAFDHASQISGQLVIFRGDNVRMIGREVADLDKQFDDF